MEQEESQRSAGMDGSLASPSLAYALTASAPDCLTTHCDGKQTFQDITQGPLKSQKVLMLSSCLFTH